MKPIDKRLVNIASELQNYRTSIPSLATEETYVQFLDMVERFSMLHDTLRSEACLGIKPKSGVELSHHYEIVVSVFRSKDTSELRYFPKVRAIDGDVSVDFHNNAMCRCPFEALEEALSYLRDRMLIEGIEFKDAR